MTTTSARAVSDLLADLNKRVQNLERAPRLANASIEGQPLPIYDGDQVLRQTIGQQPDGTYTLVDVNGPPPPVPSAPTIEARPGTLVVTWDGRFADDAPPPADWDHVEVHVSTVSGYTPTDETEVITFHSLKGGSVTLALDPVAQYVVLQAVSTSLTESAPTAEVPGTPLPPATGEGGIKTYFEDEQPVGLDVDDDGSLWYDTNDGNKPYRWNGGTLVWISVQDAAIAAAQADADAALAAAGSVAPDGNPPASSPAPDVTPGVESMIVKWTAISNHDPVTYDVHISTTTGFTPGPATKVGETQGSQFTIRSLPGAAPVNPGDPDPRKLVFDLPYYVKIVARDTDGSAAASAQAVGNVFQVPSGWIAADVITAREVVSGSFTGAEFAGEVFIGSTFLTAADGQRVQWGVNGIQGYRSDNTRRFNVPTNDDEDIFLDAQIVARGLQVKGGASFEGTQNEITKDAALRLSSGVSAPTGTVQAQVYYETVRFTFPTGLPTTGIPLGSFSVNPTEVRSIVWNPAGLFNVYQNRNNGTRVWRFNLDGTYNSHYDFVDYDICNEVFIPGDPDGWMLFRYMPAGNTYYVVHANLFNTFTRTNTTRTPFIGHNGTNMFVGEIVPGGVQQIRLGFRTALNATNYGPLPAASSTITTSGSHTWDGGNTHVVWGGFAGGTGGNRYVASEVGGTANLQMFGPTGTWLDDDTFDPPPTTKRGILYDGSNIWTYGADGYLYKHTNFMWPAATSSVWWSRLTLRDANATGGLHETTPGPVQQLTMKRRAMLRVTFLPLPYAGGADDPDRWVLYIGRGATQPANTAMYEQATATIAVSSVDLSTLATSGANPPTVNNFPGATPGEIRDDAGNLKISGDASIKALTIVAPTIKVGADLITGDNAAIVGPWYHGYLSSPPTAVAASILTTITGWVADGSPNSLSLSHSSGIFTVPKTGRYRVRAQIWWGGVAGAVGSRTAQIMRVSPSSAIQSSIVNSSAVTGTNSYPAINELDKTPYLTAGEQIYIRFQHTDTASRSPNGSSADITWLQITWKGP
jgi:hypothetical protein